MSDLSSTGETCALDLFVQLDKPNRAATKAKKMNRLLNLNLKFMNDFQLEGFYFPTTSLKVAIFRAAFRGERRSQRKNTDRLVANRSGRN